MLGYALFALGVVLLLKGADYFIEGSSALAKRLGISSLVIGLTVVAFGTSMPELVVNIIAALNGNGEIAFGSIVGSNISNTLLVLGIIATITGFKVQKSTVRKEIPFSLLAVAVLLVFTSVSFLDGFALTHIYRFQGVLLILFFSIFLYYLFEHIRLGKNGDYELKTDIKDYGLQKAVGLISIGILGLYVGGAWVIEGAISIARAFGMSDYFISLTVIALGTSLPEIVASVKAALKNEVDLAIGGVVGSNIFNIFWVLGVSSIITPIAIPVFAVADLIILFAATILLIFFIAEGRKLEVGRKEGFMLIIFYLAYILFLLL
jgi:K+-dependent Na+/Ca+ exchanger related-protein